MKRLLLILICLCASAPSLVSAATIGRPVNFIGLFLGRTTSGNIANAPLAQGLAGYWPLDGNTLNWATGKVQDVSGNGNTGQLISMSTTTSPVPGKIGQALKFAGSSTYISASASASASTYSVSLWIRYQGSTPISNIKVALSYGSGSAGSTLWMGYASDGSLAISNSNVDIKSSTISSSTSWQHLVAVVSGGTLRAYMNGVLVGSASMGSRAADTLLLGEYIGYIGTFSFPGIIDDVRVYNRALSASDIAALYAAGSVGVGRPNPYSISSGLVAYWSMNGNTVNWSTGTMQDSAGHGYTARLVNLATTTAPVSGKIGQALKFNGTNQYLTVSPAPTTRSPLTVAAWVYPTSLTGGRTIVDTDNNGGSFVGWVFTVKSNGQLWFWPASGKDKFSTGTISINTWSHIVATYDGTNVSFYINGVLDSTQAMQTPQDNITTFAIGNDSWTGNYWAGSLDDVRLYSRALSANEVQALYVQGK